MKIKFIGAARTVTGSKHLIITNKEKKILLDCGLFQNKGSENEIRNRHFSFDPAEISAVILSHAHIDHSGNLPYLVKQGFVGKIYCTPATYDLCEILLTDSAHIHENDIVYINKHREKKGLAPLKPLYNLKDVEHCLPHFETVNLNEEFIIDDEISFLYTDAGHILGSAAVSIKIKEENKTIHLFFSGDVGRSNDLILKAPQKFPQADYILCESTYGDRLHDEHQNATKKLQEVIIDTCINRKGKLIIPAFSLGRTQEIVYSIDRLISEKKLPEIKVYVDSPLSINATNIMRKHPEGFNDDILAYMNKDADPFGFAKLTYIQDVEESKALNDSKEPCIIISASGMMEAGRVKHHIKNNISDAVNTILIVGYCPPNTLGGMLLDGKKKVKIYGIEYDVEAKIETISSYSAHADYKELLTYLSCQDKTKVKRLFLVHGDYKAQRAFKETLLKEGYNNIEIPDEEEVFELH